MRDASQSIWGVLLPDERRSGDSGVGLDRFDGSQGAQQTSRVCNRVEREALERSEVIFVCWLDTSQGGDLREQAVHGGILLDLDDPGVGDLVLLSCLVHDRCGQRGWQRQQEVEE